MLMEEQKIEKTSKNSKSNILVKLLLTETKTIELFYKPSLTISKCSCRGSQHSEIIDGQFQEHVPMLLTSNFKRDKSVETVYSKCFNMVKNKSTNIPL